MEIELPLHLVNYLSFYFLAQLCELVQNCQTHADIVISGILSVIDYFRCFLLLLAAEIHSTCRLQLAMPWYLLVTY